MTKTGIRPSDTAPALEAMGIKPRRKRKAERLLQRLRDELHLNLPETAYIRRTYAGRRLRAGGAFVWVVAGLGPNDVREIGSQETVTDLLRARRLVVGRPHHSFEYPIAAAAAKEGQ